MWWWWWWGAFLRGKCSFSGSQVYTQPTERKQQVRKKKTRRPGRIFCDGTSDINLTNKKKLLFKSKLEPSRTKKLPPSRSNFREQKDDNAATKRVMSPMKAGGGEGGWGRGVVGRWGGH